MRLNKITSLIFLSLLTTNFSCGKGADDTGETGDTGDTTTPNLLVNGLESELVNFGGCGDIFMYAHSDSDEIGLFIGATGIIQQAFDLGTDTSTFTVEIGSDDGQAMVVLQSGIRITTFACNDAIVPGSEPVVSQELTATGGTLTFQITPNGEATDWGELPAAGEVMLTGVEFTTAEGDSIVIDSWGFQAPVGWLPG